MSPGYCFSSHVSTDFELIARHRRPAREVGRQQILRVRDELVAVPEPDRVAVPGMRAVHVLVLLTDVDASYPRPVIVDHVRLVRQVDELVRVGLEQPPRIAGRLAVRQTIVLDFAELLLLAPALLVGVFVRRRQHALANLAGKSRRIDEHVHVGIAGGHPQAVPARHGGDRVLRAALGLLERDTCSARRTSRMPSAEARPRAAARTRLRTLRAARRASTAR